MTNNPNTTNPTSVNRRAMLAGSSAVVGGLALSCPAPALANAHAHGHDAELKALWSEYLVALDRWERAMALSTRAEERSMTETPRCWRERGVFEDLTAPEGSPERFVGKFYYMESGEEIHFSIPLEVTSINDARIKARETAEDSYKEHERQKLINQRKHGVAKLERALLKLRPPVEKLEARIFAAKAYGIEGVAIKLAISKYNNRTCDDDATPSAYQALCDLTGTDYAAEAFNIEERAWA
jgi:hypothetical protein